MTPSLPQGLLLLLFVGVFIHFLVAGARTFATSMGDDIGAAVATLSFLVLGGLLTSVLGLRQPVHPVNGVAAALLVLCALALYEWARRIIWGRRFHIAWSERTPEQVCAAGPYRYLRHPIYVSYMLTFLGVLIALPSWVTLASFLLNVALFAHAAFNDERSLANSPIAADYAAYRVRTRMFFPVPSGRR